MSSRLLAVTYDVAEPARAAAFWAEILGRRVETDGAGVLLQGDQTQVGLRFEQADRVVPPRLHLHLTSTSAEDQQRTVARVLDLGGRHVDREPDPEDGFVVLVDPDGNELCVIEPGNGYLAGTGFLGEVTCEGTHAVGLFWRAALGWPLVWDQDEESAIQSPDGGTKLAWGGPPVAPKQGRNAERFELVTDHLATEVQRLVSLGAVRLEDRNGRVELADPDGNEFLVRDDPLAVDVVGASPRPTRG